MLNLDAVLTSRQSPETWMKVVDTYCSLTAGQDAYRRASTDNVSSWLTASTEAFTLLLVENYHDWARSTALRKKQQEEQLEQQEESSEQEAAVVPPKYTFAGKGAGRNMGWSHEGIKRYNELFKLVKEDRLVRGEVDENYFKRKQLESLEQARKKRKRATKTLEELEKYVMPDDDMSCGGPEEDDEAPAAASATSNSDSSTSGSNQGSQQRQPGEYR